MKIITRALLGWLTVACALICAPAHAAGATLLARARAMGLAESTAWQRLIHYRPDAWGEVESEVDGGEFFLARDGKHDPEAELEATLSAFSAPFVAGREDQHAACRFPARWVLLDEQLHFTGPLRAPRCPALERFQALQDVESVSVVYSANFLNNPASALGHTFLRLRKRRAPGAVQPSEQLDAGVEFTAEPDTKNPLLYAFKGITGMFPGVFRFHTYEEKLREYGNSEARDIWEYDLALSPREVQLLALHLWELAATHIDYYYISENCSYHILGVLEAAAPRIHLVSGLKVDVLPKDTIKALVQAPGLVRGVHYRPSLRSQLHAHLARMGPHEEDAAERLVRDPDAVIPAEFSPEARARVLDAAIVVLEARLAKLPDPRGDPSTATIRARLVQRRAELAAPPAPIEVPADKAPERGHGSMRITLGTGTTTQYGNAFGTFGYRLTLHDLADPPDGEPELSQVQFLDTRLRYDLRRRELTVDAFTFAELLALNPLNRFEKALSWHARGFGVRLHDRGCPDCFAHGLEAAVGGTLATEDERLAAFVMAEGSVAFSASLDGIGGSFVRAGLGAYAGVRARLPARTIGVVTGRLTYLPGQDLHGTYEVRGSIRGALTGNVALGFEGAVQPLSSELQFSSYFYF